MSASCPDTYLPMKLDRARDALCSSGRTAPLTVREMLGCVSANGCERTDAMGTLGTSGEELLGEGRAITKGSGGEENSRCHGMGLIAVALASMKIESSAETMLKDCKVTRSEKLGGALLWPGGGKPGTEGTTEG